MCDLCIMVIYGGHTVDGCLVLGLNVVPVAACFPGFTTLSRLEILNDLCVSLTFNVCVLCDGLVTCPGRITWR